MLEKRVELNKSAGEEERIPCGTCNTVTRHVAMTSVDVDEDDGEIQYWYQHQILRCKGCDTLSFRSDWQSTDDFFLDDNEAELIHHEELFPPRLAGRLPIRVERFLPFEIGLIYRETHQALCSRQRVLAGVGIGVLIEAVCRDQGAPGNNLKDRIDALATKGVLTADGAEILHSLRDTRNAAAHEIRPHREDELSAAFDVVEHLLNSVYLLKVKAAHLPKRRGKGRSNQEAEVDSLLFGETPPD